MSYMSALKSNYHFNPRSREGSDLEAADQALSGCKISIHAPVKGATAYNGNYAKLVTFQSTLP